MGCTDSIADNYVHFAVVDDGSCIISGCLDSTNPWFDPRANRDGGLEACMVVVPGCMDSTACCGSYSALATVHNEADCSYKGCAVAGTLNYDDSPNVVNDASMCIFKVKGCMDSAADTYKSSANIHLAQFCKYAGCMDPANPGFDDAATIPDPSACDVLYHGCMLSGAFNFETFYNADDGSCVCPSTMEDTASCKYVLGCTDEADDNYKENANLDDGSCASSRRRALEDVYGDVDLATLTELDRISAEMSSTGDASSQQAWPSTTF